VLLRKHGYVSYLNRKKGEGSIESEPLTVVEDQVDAVVMLECVLSHLLALDHANVHVVDVHDVIHDLELVGGIIEYKLTYGGHVALSYSIESDVGYGSRLVINLAVIIARSIITRDVIVAIISIVITGGVVARDVVVVAIVYVTIIRIIVAVARIVIPSAVIATIVARI
jgi:hypothetical protein